MHLSTRIRTRILRDYVIGWSLAFLFLSIVRGVGTVELGSLKFGFIDSLKMSFSLGPVMGLVTGLIQIRVEEKWYRRIPILRLLLLRTLFGILTIAFLVVSAYYIYGYFFGIKIGLFLFAFDKGSGAIYFYVIFTDLVMSILRQVNLMLGHKTFGKMLTGKFYHPREEKRIFMFLDLQSSTTHAEKLGHLKYSSLIQDCFNDLGVVIEDDAEIYQYVGDEAVLTWPYEQGLRDGRAVRAFFRFKDELAARADYYQQTYQVKPFFKAGLHGGLVTVTEIGKYKKEIAYHGDPINTAARIQGQCNALGAELLISKPLKDALPSTNFHFNHAGDLSLRGKQQSVEVYKVSRSKTET